MEYIREYRMKFQGNQVEVWLVDNEGIPQESEPVETFLLNEDRFKLNASFSIPEHVTDLVNLTLDLSNRIDQENANSSKVKMTIQSQIKLSRNL